MPKLKQFQVIGDASGWFVIGLETGGALWYGTPTVQTPIRSRSHGLELGPKGCGAFC